MPTRRASGTATSRETTLAEFSVLAASQKKTVESKHGPRQVINLTLAKEGEAAPVQCEWFTLATTAIPAPGSKLEGELESGQYGMSFKKAQNNGGFGGGRGGRSPEERRSIARQHAQKVAMQYAEIKGEKGDLPEKYKVSDLKPIIDWLFNDVLEAEKG
jgi:hypothetical protein